MAIGDLAIGDLGSRSPTGRHVTGGFEGGLFKGVGLKLPFELVGEPILPGPRPLELRLRAQVVLAALLVGGAERSSPWRAASSVDGDLGTSIDEGEPTLGGLEAIGDAGRLGTSVGGGS